MQLISGGLEFSGSVLTLNLIKEPLYEFAARFSAGAALCKRQRQGVDNGRIGLLARDSVIELKSTAVEPTAVLN